VQQDDRRAVLGRDIPAGELNSIRSSQRNVFINCAKAFRRLTADLVMGRFYHQVCADPGKGDGFYDWIKTGSFLLCFHYSVSLVWATAR
jgi:hypothetical protein